MPEWRECAKAAIGYDSLCVKFSKLVMDEGAAGRFKSTKESYSGCAKEGCVAVDRIGSRDFRRGAHTASRRRKIRCTTRISSP